ncbi:MAG: pyridoxal-dependent decarboxylase, partial [Gammaproteobacteria bacterium]
SVLNAQAGSAWAFSPSRLRLSTSNLLKKESHHMDAETFRRHGYALIDWLADYQSNAERYPVLSQVEPGDIRRSLPKNMPELGESFDEIFKDFENIILPGVTHWQSPNFFGYFPANNSAPSILGELLSAGLGVQGMLWLTSPACTELETHVLDWLVDALALPEMFKSDSNGGGVIQDSASSATLCALLTARERVSRFDSKENGVDRRFVAYCSDQTHSSMEKAMMIAGLGRRRLRKIATDSAGAMIPGELLQCIEADRKQGLVPFFVCATIGTTSTLAVDPVPEIGAICQQQRLWLHVDAAMAGTATICPEFHFLNDGLEAADSYCFNPHKWMFTNFDCDCFFVADRFELIATLSVLPEYLRNRATETGDVIDYRDWQIPLGRRFRALKLWFVLRHYGVAGLQHHIRQHIEWAADLEREIAAHSDFECALPRSLNLICFYHRSGSEFSKKILDAVNESGKLFVTHTTVDDRYCIRFCVGQTHTSLAHVREAWRIICRTAEELDI